MNLGVINQPDSPAVSCDFQPFSFYLGGKRTYWGLPNNPDYDLGPLIGSGCDTLHLNIDHLSNDKNELIIFPNPSNGIVNFYLQDFSDGKIIIYDALGKIIKIKNFENGKTMVSGLTSGLYSAQLILNGNRITIKKFIVM
jgi:hypothetical protein